MADCNENEQKKGAECGKSENKTEKWHIPEVVFPAHWWDGVFYPEVVFPAEVWEVEPWHFKWDEPAPPVNNNKNTGDQDPK